MGLFRIFDDAVGERPIQLPVPASGATQLPGVPATQPAIVSIVGTVSSDPGASQDSTQGYSPGAIVFNTTAGQLRFWSCRDATAGAAKWVFEGADYANGGTNPTIEITQFGGAPTAQMAEEGNINRQINLAGQSPGATGSDYVLAVYNLPAGAFDANGRGLNIMACGTMAGSHVNTVKIIVGATAPVVGQVISGGTTIASMVTTAAASGNGGWQISANIFKSGALGSNTQIALHEASQSGSQLGTLVAPTTNLALAENAIIPIAITGNAATTAADIAFNFLEVNAMN
jgi:hypothetical protein